ncbi:MAG: zinc-ribbon domain-containing protein [Methanobacterium sp.]
MVSNEEIKRMLEAKRRGIDIKTEKIKSENFKECPHCKTKNPEKALFCVHCGKKLEKNLKVKCPSCDTENLEDAKFCVSCGETLNKITSKKEPEKPINIPESSDNTIKNDIEFVKSEDDSKSLQKPEETISSDSKNSKTRFPSEVPEHNIIGETGSKKICPSCNGKNLKTAKFCIVCGKNFDETENDISSDNPADESDESGQTFTTKEMPTPEIKVPKNILELKNEDKNEESDETFDTAAIETGDVKESEKVMENIDPVEKIKKAKELLDIGAITSEEFENIKKKYLELI